MGGTSLDQVHPDRGRKCRHVFSKNKEMDNIILPAGLLDKILVSFGEGIGIHDYCGYGCAFPAVVAQVLQEALEAGKRFFHEIQLVIHMLEQRKAQMTKGRSGTFFGIHVDGRISMGEDIVYKKRNKLIENRPALVTGINSNAFQDIVEPGASCNKPVLLKDPIGDLYALLCLDSFLDQQLLPYFTVPGAVAHP